jgi:hypothetical protein
MIECRITPDAAVLHKESHPSYNCLDTKTADRHVLSLDNGAFSARSVIPATCRIIEYKFETSIVQNSVSFDNSEFNSFRNSLTSLKILLIAVLY